MSADGVPQRDSLKDFARRDITVMKKRKLVFVSGTGPAVIVMTELPGITPNVARFARRVRDAGFTVYMPNLFGDPGSPGGPLKTARAIVQICVSREFHLLNSYSSGPIADWLRGLAALAHRESDGKGVGAIGMCVTGNFALSMMLEPVMLAPVLSQPSLPFANHAGMHIRHDELRVVRERLDREHLSVRAYRFRGDSICRAARFTAYQAALGDRFVPTVIEDEHAKEYKGRNNPHSVVTKHLIDEAGEPTRQALDEILEFFCERLKSAGTGGGSSAS
jgi:dienelactone hydrolase